MQRSARRFVGLLVALGVGAMGSAVSEASGPPGPGPFPHVALEASGPPEMTCVDPGGTIVYQAPAWTLDPLLRGPLFAPTVLFLDGSMDLPVAPLRFTSTAFPIVWSTNDGGPLLGGTIESLSGRPLGYGPLATSPAPMVTCSYELIGHVDFGSFLITKALQQQLGLPVEAVGRTVIFDGEGTVTFEVRADQFPLTATYDPLVQPWLVEDVPEYPWVSMPTITCRSAGRVVYRGPATTLAPLVRGLDWAPMGFFLPGDRMVMPHWSRVQIDASWATVEGEPARSGTIDTDMRFAPSGLGPNPWPTSKVIDCSWRVVHDEIIHATPYLAVQLVLPNRVVDRDIRIVGSATVHAYVAAWLFPPSS